MPGVAMKNFTLVFANENCSLFPLTTDNDGIISLNGLPPGQDYSVYLNAVVPGNEDILIVWGADAVRVLKTKHDTAKNSVSNIR